MDDIVLPMPPYDLTRKIRVSEYKEYTNESESDPDSDCEPKRKYSRKDVEKRLLKALSQKVDGMIR